MRGDHSVAELIKLSLDGVEFGGDDGESAYHLLIFEARRFQEIP